jgi:heme exporter protein D
LSDFLAMGGYGAYVWTSFGLTALVLGLNYWLASKRLRAVQGSLRRRYIAGDIDTAEPAEK